MRVPHFEVIFCICMVGESVTLRQRLHQLISRKLRFDQDIEDITHPRHDSARLAALPLVLPFLSQVLSLSHGGVNPIS